MCFHRVRVSLIRHSPTCSRHLPPGTSASQQRPRIVCAVCGQRPTVQDRSLSLALCPAQTGSRLLLGRSERHHFPMLYTLNTGLSFYPGFPITLRASSECVACSQHDIPHMARSLCTLQEATAFPVPHRPIWVFDKLSRSTATPRRPDAPSRSPASPHRDRLPGSSRTDVVARTYDTRNPSRSRTTLSRIAYSNLSRGSEHGLFPSSRCSRARDLPALSTAGASCQLPPEFSGQSGFAAAVCCTVLPGWCRTHCGAQTICGQRQGGNWHPSPICQTGIIASGVKPWVSNGG
ncbi:hypothetical protein BD311DRAFT_746138 [Dichomitus squalens]|uniref:Uncharacterized protein n=1 Tax=Dichomitus squalens TaxID=114155 RepID=A0A4Q9N2M8_9APHY|nr:hypothetical protein BD311DRAFT_746138 [Dichomitus squalens]